MCVLYSLSVCKTIIKPSKSNIHKRKSCSPVNSKNKAKDDGNRNKFTMKEHVVGKAKESTAVLALGDMRGYVFRAKTRLVFCAGVYL